MADHVEVLRAMLESPAWIGAPEDRDALQAAVRALESLRGGGECRCHEGNGARDCSMHTQVDFDMQDAYNRGFNAGLSATTPELPEGERGEEVWWQEPPQPAAVQGGEWAARVAGYIQGANDHAGEPLDQIELRAAAEGDAIHAGIAAAPQPQDPVLDKPARIGATVFTAGVRWDTVIDRAQREYEWHENPPFPNADMDGLRKLLDTPPASGGVEETRLLERARAAVRVLRTILHKGNLRTGAEVSDQLLTDLDSFIVANSAPTPSPTSARELPECKHDAYLGACVHCGAGIRSGHVVSAPPLRGVNIFHPYYEAGFNAGREFEMAQQILADEITKDLSSCMAMVERSPSGSVMYPSPDFHEAAAKFLITHGDILARRGGSDE